MLERELAAPLIEPNALWPPAVAPFKADPIPPLSRLTSPSKDALPCGLPVDVDDPPLSRLAKDAAWFDADEKAFVRGLLGNGIQLFRLLYLFLTICAIIIIYRRFLQL